MKVGIIGCGIAGLAAAGCLAVDGHEVEILERADQPVPIGAGLLLQPPGAAILKEMGILDRVAQTASQIRRLDSRTPSGRRIIDLDYADLAPGLHGLGIRRAAIWSALFDHARQAGARLSTNITVLAVAASEDGARIEDQSGGVRHYDLAVNASGTHSSVALQGLKRRANPYDWGCLWTTIRLRPDWRQDVLAQRCRGTRIMIGVLPTGIDDDGYPTAALYWSVRNDEVAAWRDQPIGVWLAEVERTWPELVPLITHLRHDDFQHGTYRDVWADPSHAGRIMMIGDAAHGTSPQLGQGVTQALRDSRALTLALRGDGRLEDKLATYWSSRKGATAYYRWASRLLTPAFQSEVPGIGLLRDLFAGLMNDLFKRQALLTLAGMKTGLFHSEWNASFANAIISTPMAEAPPVADPAPS